MSDFFCQESCFRADTHSVLPTISLWFWQSCIWSDQVPVLVTIVLLGRSTYFSFDGHALLQATSSCIEEPKKCCRTKRLSKRSKGVLCDDRFDAAIVLQGIWHVRWCCYDVFKCDCGVLSNDYFEAGGMHSFEESDMCHWSVHEGSKYRKGVLSDNWFAAAGMLRIRHSQAWRIASLFRGNRWTWSQAPKQEGHWQHR